MTFLGSHIPVLYCMLYYRTNIPGYTGPSQPSTHNFSNISGPSRLNSRTDGILSNHLRRPSEDVSWVYHHRNRDLNKLCSSAQNRGTARHSNRHDVSPEACSVIRPEDVRRMLPDRFLSEEELRKILPRLDWNQDPESHMSKLRAVRKFVAASKKHASLKMSTYGGLGDMHCGTCVTDVSYEVLSEIIDFYGETHTVLNFNNSYQFIPAGRCGNENSPCGGGGNAKCKQVYRAHWTLVWAHNIGAQLVAHEVPSHCECMNIGGTQPSSIPPLTAIKLDTPPDEGGFKLD